MAVQLRRRVAQGQQSVVSPHGLFLLINAYLLEGEMTYNDGIGNLGVCRYLSCVPHKCLRSVKSGETLDSQIEGGCQGRRALRQVLGCECEGGPCGVQVQLHICSQSPQVKGFSYPKAWILRNMIVESHPFFPKSPPPLFCAFRSVQAKTNVSETVLC